MKSITAFLKLIRWPNLVFIVLTQVCFYYFIIIPTFKQPAAVKLLLALSLSSVLIAAAGYIINDYFDLNIDLVNKPGKTFIGSYISRRWAIFWHLLFSLLGILLSIYVSLNSNFIIFIGNTAAVLLLWFYSTRFKKQLLIGNVVISLLTAWVIIVVYLMMNKSFIFYTPHNNQLHKLFRFAILYAGFSFIISLVREVIKDIEDINGDARYGCKTMPILWGVPVAKVFAAVWMVVLISALIILQFYVLQVGWWFSALYTVAFLIYPLLRILINLYNASVTGQYHQLSKAVKLVMLAGIISMIFVKIYS